MMSETGRQFFRGLRSYYGKDYNDGASFGFPAPGHWEHPTRWRSSALGIHRAYLAAASDDASAYPTTLEIGCGRGVMVHELRELGIPAVGVDIGSDEMRSFCAQANAMELPFADKFDLVIALDVVEHIPTDFQDDLHAELHRLTGSFLVVTVPASEPYFEYSMAEGYRNHYIQTTPAGWATYFVKHGWKILAQGAQLASFGLPFNIGLDNYPLLLRPPKVSNS